MNGGQARPFGGPKGAENAGAEVGLTEFYTETLCLLHFREHGSVPGSCACGGLGPLNRTKHFAHGSPRHTLTALVA